MPSPAQDAIKASAGGLFALCALYPLDLLRTKRAAESSTSNENSKKKKHLARICFHDERKGDFGVIQRALFAGGALCVLRSDLLWHVFHATEPKGRKNAV